MRSVGLPLDIDIWLNDLANGWIRKELTISDSIDSWADLPNYVCVACFLFSPVEFPSGLSLLKYIEASASKFFSGMLSWLSLWSPRTVNWAPNMEGLSGGIERIFLARHDPLEDTANLRNGTLLHWTDPAYFLFCVSFAVWKLNDRLNSKSMEIKRNK